MTFGGKAQAMGLGLLIILAIGGLGYWLFHQLQIPDPAARVRRQYAASQVAPASADQPSRPGPASSRSLSEQPGMQVQSGPQGNILSVEPAEIAAVESRKPAEAKPEVQVPGEIHPPVLPTPLPSHPGPWLASPPVPQKLLDQTPPESFPSANSPPVATQLRVAPRRYLFNNMAPEATQGKSVQVRPETQQDFNPETFSPMGEDITLALMNNVASNSFEVPVAAAVWQPFYFQGHLLLKLGDKIIGNALAGKNRDRILVTFTRIILKDGRSLPIQATALDVDGTVGVRGFVVGENLLKTLTPVLLEAVRGFSEVLQNRTETSSVSILGSATETTLGNDLGTKGIEAGRGALDKISQIISQDLEENRPYILAVAGTPCHARLLQPLDLSQADYGK